MLLPILTILFFGSGLSALVYQVLWVRVLGWVFGVTVYAASTVWAGFMAGLAIGSLVAGRAGDRVRHPLRWFGITELLIGATALSTPVMVRLLQQVYIRLYPSLPHSLAALTAARFAIGFAVLIVPTALMGATLPLVIKSSEFRRGHLGTHVGVLYGSNTSGAIVGTLLAGLYLIPVWGIHGAFIAAAIVNLVVGASAILFSVAIKPHREVVAIGVQSRAAVAHAIGPLEAASPIAARPSGDAVASATPVVTTRRLRLVLAVFALSGFVSLGFEVAWFRVLTLFLRPTVYGFAIMLATILAGIALGSYTITPWLDRRARWITVLGLLELGIAVTALLSFRPLVAIQSLNDSLAPHLGRIMPVYLVFPISGSLLAIFPTALLMGMAFPIGLRLWAGGDGDEAVSERIGVFYSANVAAAIGGSLLAGFVLLPLIGSRAALGVLASLSGVAGLALIAASEPGVRARMLMAAAGVVAIAAALITSPDPFREFMAYRYPDQTIVWKEEGIDSTVVVDRAPTGDLSLTVNGNHQASTDGSTTYVHRRIGHLPMAIHPDPRSALVIGLGGGATAGAVSIHGASVDVVELAAAVIRAARFFDAINYGVLARPNVRLRVDDGRNYMMLTRRRYDVVTADVIHPIYAGSGNLYSAEYFRLMRSVLRPGGVVVQWVAGTDAEYKIITRTFLSVFPQATAWADGSLLVGSVEPLKLRRSDFDQKLQAPGSAQGLHDLGIESFDALLAAFRAGPDDLRAFAGPGPILTDDKPLVEYFLSLPRDRDVDPSGLKGDVRPYVVEP